MKVTSSIFRVALGIAAATTAAITATAQEKPAYGVLLVELSRLIESEHLSPPPRTEVTARALAAARQYAAQNSDEFESCVAGAVKKKGGDVAEVTLAVIPPCLGLGEIEVTKAEETFASLAEAMLSATGHSEERYISPADVAKAQNPRASIGLSIRRDGETVVVVASTPSSPAARAGIKVGDILTAIDEVPLSGLSLDAIIDKLRGEPGTAVTLMLMGDEAHARTVVMDRELIDPPSAVTAIRENDKLLVSISYMPADLMTQLEQAIKAHSTDIQLLVLDLRSNYGGVLESSVAVADAFLSKGVIVKLMKNGSTEKIYKADSNALLANVPMIILTDENTAAGAEILAAALSDNGRARVVGRRTAGKGMIRTALLLNPERVVVLTTQSLIRPNGIPIANVGVSPDCATDPASFNLSTFEGCPASATASQSAAIS